jgi:hypothetical protein
VPDVSFDAGSSVDATRDSTDLDVRAEAEAAADAEGDANLDAVDSGDAGTDAPEYCTLDADFAPDGFECCPGYGSIVCGGTSCSSQACVNCVACAGRWPWVCCTSMGNRGTCTPPDAQPCP